MTPGIELNDDKRIPQVGLGLWQVKDDESFNAAFDAAVIAGYRHFDSAQIYGNEALLGAAIKRSGLKRSEVFVTTKISVTNFGARRTSSSFEKSLENLQSEYVDLLLLHFPVTGLRKHSWLELERIHKSGQAKSIGVSNYTVRHLKQLETYANVVPAVNQVELHVFLQQPELVAYCASKGITIEAYSPLAHGEAMDDSTVSSIAQKHGKSYAQIMLRWCIDQGFVVLPKSVTPSRIVENIAIFDFKLDDDDLAQLSKLDRDLRTCWDPTHVP